jgi:hypothetical protein
MQMLNVPCGICSVQIGNCGMCASIVGLLNAVSSSDYPTSTVGMINNRNRMQYETFIALLDVLTIPGVTEKKQKNFQ